jgi:hypothetical protein
VSRPDCLGFQSFLILLARKATRLIDRFAGNICGIAAVKALARAGGGRLRLLLRTWSPLGAGNDVRVGCVVAEVVKRR